MLTEAAPVTVERMDTSPDSTGDGYWRGVGRHLRHDPSGMLGAFLVTLVVAAALVGPLLAPYGPNEQLVDGLTLDGRPLAPSAEHWLGTDRLGRDQFARLMAGARISLMVAVNANLLAALVGLLIGGLAGMAGPFVQSVLMRVVDIILSFPIFLAAIALLAVVPPTVTTIVLLIAAGFSAYVSRLVFTQVSTLREREYVLAARGAGVGSLGILCRHLTPHALPSVLVFTTLGVATAVQLEAGLSFVGIGVQPPTASWGNMIADGQTFLRTAPWLAAAPSAAVVLTMLAFGLLGDGVRDAMAPTQRVAVTPRPRRALRWRP